MFEQGAMTGLSVDPTVTLPQLPLTSYEAPTASLVPLGEPLPILPVVFTHPSSPVPADR